MKQFRDDLAGQVRANADEIGGEATAEEIGFMDLTGLAAGTEWPTALAESLNTCRVLVCLYTPRYFTSPNCGKELSLFRSRVARYAETEKLKSPPLLVLPVLWGSPKMFKPPRPWAVSKYQDWDSELGEVYRKEGLYYLKATGRDDEYNAVVIRLAQRLVKMAYAHQAPPLDPFPRLEEGKSAWEEQPPPPPPPPGGGHTEVCDRSSLRPYFL